MDSLYSKMQSDDSEELFRRYMVVGPELRNGYDLIGIVGAFKLAEAGHQRAIIQNIRALEETCHGGRLELVDLIIQAAEAHGGQVNWNDELTGACCSSDMELMRLVIKRGAKYCGWCLKPAAKH
jgi:hypothetical protein